MLDTEALIQRQIEIALEALMVAYNAGHYGAGHAIKVLRAGLPDLTVGDWDEVWHVERD